MKKRFALACALVAALAAPLAQAQRREVEHREVERYHTEHWVYDNRFHHNHYYPALGYGVTALPPGGVAIGFRGARFFFHSGVWYQPVGPRFVVVRPPVGIIVPVLPPSYATVWTGGIPYYYANDTYYEQAPGGYAVVDAPAVENTAAAAPPPPSAPAQPAASAPQTGSWYYCESSKAYYPYVSSCAEGWKQVPAAPPPAPPR
jgi:hypothetical protein